MNHYRENQTTRGLMNISLGLIIISFLIEKIVKKTANMSGYLMLIIALLLLALGLYKLFRFKQPIEYNSRLGKLNIIIGSLFSIALFASWYEQGIPVYALLIGLVGSTISLALGILLLTKKS